MSHSAADSNDSQTTPAPTTAQSAHRQLAESAQSSSSATTQRIVTTALAKMIPTRPLRTYKRPRPTLWFVVRRTWARAIALQVWDVAATMTFYLVLSLLPGLIAISSIVSVANFTEETIWTVAGLVNDLLPALEAATVANTLLSLIDTPGGLTALTLGLIGSLYSASNVVAAFHRAMNRIYDTREGRPFIYFRFIVFIETVVLIVASLALLILIILGGDLSLRLGQMLGLTEETVAAWNILKWPLILVVLIFLVSQAFYRGPNVERPRYRFMTTGAAVTVIVLFASLALTGWLLDRVAIFEQVFTTVNGILYVILMVWLAFIVMLVAAAWDAEMLRARQLASGYRASDELQLATEHTWVLRRLDAEAANRRRISGIIVDNYHNDEPVTTPRTPQLAEAEGFWAIKEPDYRPSTGTPFHAVTPTTQVEHDLNDDAAPHASTGSSASDQRTKE